MKLKGYGVYVVALFIALGPFVAAQADGDDPNKKTVEQGFIVTSHSGFGSKNYSPRKNLSQVVKIPPGTTNVDITVYSFDIGGAEEDNLTSCPDNRAHPKLDHVYIRIEQGKGKEREVFHCGDRRLTGGTTTLHYNVHPSEEHIRVTLDTVNSHPGYLMFFKFTGCAVVPNAKITGDEESGHYKIQCDIGYKGVNGTYVCSDGDWERQGQSADLICSPADGWMMATIIISVFVAVVIIVVLGVCYRDRYRRRSPLTTSDSRETIHSSLGDGNTGNQLSTLPLPDVSTDTNKSEMAVPRGVPKR